jgi:hypothetical protein
MPFNYSMSTRCLKRTSATARGDFVLGRWLGHWLEGLNGLIVRLEALRKMM